MRNKIVKRMGLIAIALLVSAGIALIAYNRALPALAQEDDPIHSDAPMDSQDSLLSEATCYVLEGTVEGSYIQYIALYPEGVYHMGGIALNMIYAGTYRQEGDRLILETRDEHLAYKDAWILEVSDESIVVVQDLDRGLLGTGDRYDAATRTGRKLVDQPEGISSVYFPELSDVLRDHHITLP